MTDAANVRPGALIGAIVLGGIIAGPIDILAAALINMAPPGIILQAVAKGLLGPASFKGGTQSMMLGAGLQVGMALIISAIYGLASLRLPDLYRKPLPWGLLYGVGVYVVMTFVVVPLSAAKSSHFPSLKSIALNLLAMFLFGLLLSFTGWLMVGRRPA